MFTNQSTRRSFLRGASATAAVLATAGSARRVLGANERIRIGSIGTGGMGSFHLGQLKTFEDVEVVAVCDVDEAHRNRAVKTLGTKPTLTKDFREVLDRKDVDAVFIAVPDHWHALPAISAMQAGKDVYLEKPFARTVAEGRRILETARKTKRVLQTGTQQRSGPHWIHAIDRIHKGEIGTVTTVNVWNAWNTDEMDGRMGNPPDSDPPPGVDYDLWLGPAPKRPFNKARFHGLWYYFWDYSGGMTSGWGVHLFDVVFWALGYSIKSASSVGGRYVLKDARETPDTQQAIFDCEKYVMTYCVRHANGWRLHDDMDHGIEFIGTKGVLQANRKGFKMFHESDRATRKAYYSEPAAGGEDWGHSLTEHKKNFFACMRSRKQTNAHAQVGHESAIPGHLANISYRVGRSIQWDVNKEAILGDAEAAELLTARYRSPWALPTV